MEREKNMEEKNFDLNWGESLRDAASVAAVKNREKKRISMPKKRKKKSSSIEGKEGLRPPEKKSPVPADIRKKRGRLLASMKKKKKKPAMSLRKIDCQRKKKKK